MYKLKPLFQNNIDKIDWCLLSTNPNAVDLLKKNYRKIKWVWLSRNPNPNAIYLIERLYRI